MGHIYIVLTILFTTYGQLVLRWQMSQVGALPEGFGAKITFLLWQFANPWVLSGFFSAFLAALAWMAAMTKFEISYAYPFMSLAFVFVMVFAAVFLSEGLTLPRVMGTIMVVLGLFVLTR